MLPLQQPDENADKKVINRCSMVYGESWKGSPDVLYRMYFVTMVWCWFSQLVCFKKTMKKKSYKILPSIPCVHSQTSSSSCNNSEDICLRNYVLRRVSVNWLASSTLQAIPDAVTQKVWPTLMVSTSLCLFFHEKFHSSTSHSVLPWVTQICLTSAEKYKPVYPHSHTVNKIRWKRWKYPPINKQQIMQCIEKEKKLQKSGWLWSRVNTPCAHYAFLFYQWTSYKRSLQTFCLKRNHN